MTLLLFNVLLCCRPAFSEDTSQSCPDCSKQEQKKLTLPEVLVTAFHGGAVTITPTKTIIDISKFDKAAPVDRVEDVLQHMVGIDVMKSSAADPQQFVMMRGFDDSRFVVAIDGRPITSPTAGADTFVDWSSLTTGDIEKIEIIRGASSARYESSQGGIINLVMKKGKSAGNSLKPNFKVQTSYSSFNTVTSRVSLDGSLHSSGIPNLSYLFNYGYKTSDGYLRNNNWRGNDYSFRLNYQLPAKGNLSASYKYSDIHLGYPVVNEPGRVDYDPSYPTVKDDADTIRRGRLLAYPGGDSFKDKKASHLDFHYDQPIGNTTLMLTAFTTSGAESSWSYQRKSPSSTVLVQTYNGYNPPFTLSMDEMYKAREETQVGGMLDYRMDLWDNNTLTVGYSQRRMEVAQTDRNDLWRIHGAYFEDLLAVTDKFSLNMGLRYVMTREYTYPYKDPGSPAPAYRHLIKTELWLPKFTATYRCSPETEVFVSANRDFHYPGC